MPAAEVPRWSAKYEPFSERAERISSLMSAYISSHETVHSPVLAESEDNGTVKVTERTLVPVRESRVRAGDASRETVGEMIWIGTSGEVVVVSLGREFVDSMIAF